MFVFLGSELCRQLPSDSTSRWTPLLLANGWQLHTPITDLHRQVIRHARRTQITAGVEAGRLSLLLTLKLNYKPFMKHQWIHEVLVNWICLAETVMEGGEDSGSIDIKETIQIPALDGFIYAF